LREPQWIQFRIFHDLGEEHELALEHALGSAHGRDVLPVGVRGLIAREVLNVARVLEFGRIERTDATVVN
jgi:hypothetical protein